MVRLNKWGSPHVKLWSSHQDQDYYKNVLNESELIVMGSNTFNADTFKPTPNHLLIIMTRHPDKYKSLEVPGQIEFTKESPAALSTRFKSKGYKQMLVHWRSACCNFIFKRTINKRIMVTSPEPKICSKQRHFEQICKTGYQFTFNTL